MGKGPQVWKSQFGWGGGGEGWVISSNVRKKLAFLREEQESVFDTGMLVVGRGLSVARPL